MLFLLSELNTAYNLLMCLEKLKQINIYCTLIADFYKIMTNYEIKIKNY
jgi:hypothetical protein